MLFVMRTFEMHSKNFEMYDIIGLNLPHCAVPLLKVFCTVAIISHPHLPPHLACVPFAASVNQLA